MRIALIADTHLSPRSPECVANWHAARRAVGRLAPRLTVNLGDITLDGQKHPGEFQFAAQLAQYWPTPMRCVPGNHDVGDACGESPLDARLLAAYVAHFGADHWSFRAGRWLLLGVNVQLMGSGSALEQAQWRWIEDQAALAGSHGRTALFLHRPIRPLEAGPAHECGCYVPAAACERLLSGPLRSSLRLIVSGHAHQYLDRMQDGVRHVWMPSSGFVKPDHTQARVGEQLVGIGLLELKEDSAAFDLWCPDGMVRHEVSGLQAFHPYTVGRDLGGAVDDDIFPVSMEIDHVRVYQAVPK
ncbi:MAG TPA: metallophosphoesterase [Rubrivivax sp.]|nr:metallophosphoesterase [Rubrivivax sp.]